MAGLTESYVLQVELMVVALAAVWLRGHWRAFAGTGNRPLALGLVTRFVVAVWGLGVQT